MTDLAAPHRMGTALTYARRYALFALVGIAGEDDLDAPELAAERSPPPGSPTAPAVARRPRNGILHQPPQLGPVPSAALRDVMLAEITEVVDGDGLATWVHRRMRDKNTLTNADARTIEGACEALLRVHCDDIANSIADPIDPSLPGELNDTPRLMDAASTPASGRQTVQPLVKPRRRRSKAHLAFVAAQPCLICQRTPCDAHHLKFAQPKALGRKVSDEFTVPLCRDIIASFIAMAMRLHGGRTSRSIRSQLLETFGIIALSTCKLPQPAKWPVIMEKGHRERSSVRLSELQHLDQTHRYDSSSDNSNRSQGAGAAVGSKRSPLCEARGRST